MSERLTIKHLGPIRELSIEPRDLTVLVGPQAEGKSLAAQLLYCFRDIRSQIARRLTEELVESETFADDIVRDILDGLRGVPFGYFANGTAYIRYIPAAQRTEWSVSVYHYNRRARPNKRLREKLEKLASEWRADPKTFYDVHDLPPENIFIPTERSTFTRLQATQPAALYHSSQPDILRRFAELLNLAGQTYDLYRGSILLGPSSQTDVEARHWVEIASTVLEHEQAALGGRAYLPAFGPKNWKWAVPTRTDKEKILPVEAISSGQMEAWPLFVMLAVYGYWKPTFYIEEPETHLHPRAQVELFEAIVYCLRQGSKFVITTHSPFVLFTLNNLLLKARKDLLKARKENEDGEPLDNRVAAYRLGGGGATDLMDHDTGLVDAQELESVADELGRDFEEILYGG